MGVFTKRYEELVDSIVTECRVYPAVSKEQGKGIKAIKTENAVWDTGATQTLISKKIAEALNLEVAGTM